MYKCNACGGTVKERQEKIGILTSGGFESRIITIGVCNECGHRYNDLNLLVSLDNNLDLLESLEEIIAHRKVNEQYQRRNQNGYLTIAIVLGCIIGAVAFSYISSVVIGDAFLNLEQAHLYYMDSSRSMRRSLPTVTLIVGFIAGGLSGYISSRLAIDEKNLEGLNLTNSDRSGNFVGELLYFGLGGGFIVGIVSGLIFSLIGLLAHGGGGWQGVFLLPFSLIFGGFGILVATLFKPVLAGIIVGPILWLACRTISSTMISR